MFLFLSMFICCFAFGIATIYKKDTGFKIKRTEVLINLKNTYLAFMMFLLFLICGLRAVEIGVDTQAYVDTFLYTDVLNRTVAGKIKFEIGYRIVVNIIRLFTTNENFFLLIITAIIFCGIYKFIKDNCQSSYSIALFVFLAFLYYTTFSAIRQMLALSVGINSITYLRQKKWVKAIIIISISASFHLTSLVLLCFIPFCITKWNKKKIKFAIFLTSIGICAFEQIVQIVLYFFPVYIRYWNSEMMSSKNSGIGMFAVLLISLVIYSIIRLERGTINFPNIESKEQFIIAIIGTVFAIGINLLGRRYGIFSRISRFFIPYAMILASNLYRYSGKYKLIYYFAVVTIMGGYFYIIININLYKIIPYKFFFLT